jgi:hypothetical protein
VSSVAVYSSERAVLIATERVSAQLKVDDATLSQKSRRLEFEFKLVTSPNPSLLFSLSTIDISVNKNDKYFLKTNFINLFFLQGGTSIKKIGRYILKELNVLTHERTRTKLCF